MAGYVILCGYLFFIQERIIFFPEKLDQNHTFSFPQPFEEIFIRSFDDTLLHGLLFTVKEAKGLVFYLHGNAGSVDSWGNVNEIYRKL